MAPVAPRPSGRCRVGEKDPKGGAESSPGPRADLEGERGRGCGSGLPNWGSRGVTGPGGGGGSTGQERS